MQYPQEIKPVKLNLDQHLKAIKPDESPFMLNNNVEGGDGGELSVSTPQVANTPMCEMDLPTGANHNAGRAYFPITNEEYSWTWNENGVHFVSRINPDGECQIVYDEPCINIKSDPKHEIFDAWRCKLKITKQCSKVPGGVLKQLIWVDGSDDPILCLDVEASIATNSFTTPFFGDTDPCEYVQLCVPKPNGCLVGQIVSDSLNLTNRLTGTYKFMCSFVYYDGSRESEYSDMSSLYFDDKGVCFDQSGKGASCIKFDVPLGNSMVEFINIAVSQDNGRTWKRCDQIEKYNKYQDASQYWFEREYNEELIIDSFDNTFEYTFCNDKMATALPVSISRTSNLMPIGAQGFVEVNGELGFFNYKKGTCPINKEEVDKFKIELDCTKDDCVRENVKVKVRAMVYNFFAGNHNENPSGFIYRLGSDDSDTPVRFGGIYMGNEKPFGIPSLSRGFDQEFSGKENFTVRIEGTNYSATMKQYKSSAKMGSFSEVGTVNNMGEEGNKGGQWLKMVNGEFFFNEAEFNLPKGTKGFIRMVGHGSPGDPNTSTQVKGTIPDLRTYRGGKPMSSFNREVKEIYFDTCNVESELVLNEAFVVEDMFAIFGINGVKKSSAYSGYITDIDNQPVPGARLHNGSSFYSETDHNGFYSFYIADGDGGVKDVEIKVEKDCAVFNTLETFQTESGMLQIGNKDYKIKSTSYQKFIQDVSIRIQDCNNQPVGGFRVAISQGKSRTTDASGRVTFRVRNNHTRNKVARIIAMDSGGCIKKDCQGRCNPCMPESILHLPKCFLDSNLIDVGSKSVNTEVFNNRLLKTGGLYSFAVVAEGDCGRVSAAYPVSEMKMPRVNDTNGSVCKLLYSTTSEIVLDNWVSRLKIVRSLNLNNFRLQWLVDEITRTSNGEVIFTLQSLNDYNARFGFKTNVSYQFTEGDWLDVIKNSDGKILDEVLTYKILSPVKKEITGTNEEGSVQSYNQIMIKDDGKLYDIQKGALIEINGLKDINDEPAYYEICATVPVVDGKLISDTGNFSTFDTFLVPRQVGDFAVQDFEHHSPTDFGLPNLSDIGRVHFVNKYETLKRYGRNIMLNSKNRYNYFDGRETTMEGEQQGDIVSMAIVGNRGFGICENGNFPFQVSDKTVRVNAQTGNVEAAPAGAILGQPHENSGGFYGCAYEDVGSICYADGALVFVDSERGKLVRSDYRNSIEAGLYQSKDGAQSYCSSWFTKRSREKYGINLERGNNLLLQRWVTGVNGINNNIFITIKRWADPGYQNKEAGLGENETIVYNHKKDEFTTFASFTPEGYSKIKLGTEEGCAFITYQNAIPYVHPIKYEFFNRFYGVHCDWIVDGVINEFVTKRKIPQALEVIASKMFFVKVVTTDIENNISEIRPIEWTEVQPGKWNAEVLNNINSPGGLFDGDVLNGYYFRFRFIRDNSINLAYNTVDTDKQEKFSVLDRILCKFMLSEQSGFTNNK